jgi:hypothetical protein
LKVRCLEYYGADCREKQEEFSNSYRSVEKARRHSDRSGAEHREAEKSIQKQISRLAYGSLEMTF